MDCGKSTGEDGVAGFQASGRNELSGFWSERSVLVAGGAGFVGSYLVEELVRDGAQVAVADNLEAGSLDNLSAVVGQIRFLRGDLREPAFCDEATRNRQVVMNLAARAHGIGYAAGHQAELFTGNSLINLNLLEAARKNGVPRFLVVSSSCVYPDDAIAPTPELPVFTGLPELANEGYGWSKRSPSCRPGSTQWSTAWRLPLSAHSTRMERAADGVTSRAT